MSERKGFGKEDIAVVLMVVVVGLAVFMYRRDGNSTDTSDYTPSDFCLEVATGAESNLSIKYTGVECSCISPTPYRNDTSTPEEVRNVTYIRDVVKCSANELDRDLIFPLLTINETKLSESGLNRSYVENRTGMVR